MNIFGNAPVWVSIFAVWGILALFTAVTTLFWSLGNRPARITSSEKEVPAAGSFDFLQAIAGVTNAPIQNGGRAELLNNGIEFFPAIIEAIEKAQSSVNFMVYIWNPGRASDMIFNALIAAAKRGIEVRLLLDGFGALHVPEERVAELRRVRGKVGWFRPARIGKLLRFYKRNHRRAIIIDGTTGFLGGAAIEDKWLGDGANPQEWRDSMIRVSGTMAENLQSAFTQVWADTQGEILVGPKYYPDPKEDRRNFNSTLHISVISSPSNEFHPLSKIFWLTFKSAREKIYITHSYFVPDHSLRQALKERARAGVDIRILLPNEYIDGQPIRWASHHYFEELLAAGVRIYEYQPTMIHSKTILVDGKWAVVGSANLDVRSAEINKENVLGILDVQFGAQLEETFLNDLKHAREIRLGEWKRRSWIRRLRESGATLFEEQY